MESPTPPPRPLHRALTSMEVVFLTFSALSPAMSVFIYGDSVLHMAGSGMAAAMLIGGVIAAVAALLYAELGASFPQAGGIYPSLAGVLGPFWTFPYVTMMMILAPALVAFSVLGFADYLRVLAPSLPQIPVAVACLVLACAVAVLRVRTGAIITGAFLMLEVVALLIVTVLATTHPARTLGAVLAHPVWLDHGRLTPVTAATLGLASVSSIFTCAGASWALYFGEELKDAPRRIGRVIAFTGPLAAFVIAGPLILVVLSASDLKRILAADSPVAAYVASVASPRLAMALSLGLVLAIFNAIVATIMAFGRLYYATGRDGVWPRPVNRVLAHVHPDSKAPMAATLVVCLCSLAFMALGEERLLILVSVENIPEYAMLALALLIGRRTGRCGGQFQTPFHPLIPVFGLIVTGMMIVADWADKDAGRPSLVLVSVIFVASLAYYRFRMRHPERGWATSPAEIAETP